MTIPQFLTSPQHGCCTVAELMQLAREDKAAYSALNAAARLEMTAKGITIDSK